MNDEYLNVGQDVFDDIVEEIKQKNLSRNNMPKLIIGTGLSVIYGVPGMKELSEYLHKHINELREKDVKDMWNKHYPNIQKNGLEAGLSNLIPEESVLVDVIKPMTANFILESEEKLHNEILNRDTGFSRLLKYLSGTVSINRRVIDIMTPNYDRIIELVCDKNGLGVITGFSGNIYGKFNKNLLKQPADTYNLKNTTWVRMFKPHGSLNWINENGQVYLTNNSEVLREKKEHIEIVTPGNSKYRVGLTNNTFRCMREEFNELLNPEDN